LVWSVDWRRLGSDSQGHSSRIAFTTICSSTVADILHLPPSAAKVVVGCGVDLAAALGRDQIAISLGGGAGEVREREDSAIL
jgi:hypothetical protein